MNGHLYCNGHLHFQVIKNRISKITYVEKSCDHDNPEHITWLFNTALKRAQEYNISGVTYTLTQGVVKNIIPAIASTNAIVAGKK